MYRKIAVFINIHRGMMGSVSAVLSYTFDFYFIFALCRILDMFRNWLFMCWIDSNDTRIGNLDNL